MSVREVTYLRKEGQLDKALELANSEFEEEDNAWTRMSLFWVLRDYVKCVFIPGGEIEKAKGYLRLMGTLLPGMMDDDGIGEQAYRHLYKLILPDAGKIKTMAALSKTEPDKAYERMVSEFGTKGERLDENLHEDFGWILFRYMKANSNQLTSVQTRALLRDYILLKNERPSMLHSNILNFALKFSKEHKDFNFYKFFTMWGAGNFRQEDYEKGCVDGDEIPSLISRICRTLVDTDANFPINDFVEVFGKRKASVTEYLREAYFWKLMNLHKEEAGDGLWNAFDRYVDNYSSLGPSHWHSEILKIANRFMVDANKFRFFSFMRRWVGAEMANFRKEDWMNEKGEDGKEYPSLALKAAKKCFDSFYDDPAKRSSSDSLSWQKRLYALVVEHNAADDWSERNYATLCIWSGCMDEAIDIYKSLIVNMGEKYYLWSELSKCILNNDDLCMGLLLKAKEIERNEDFLGDIHLSLANLLIKKKLFNSACRELDAYVRHRKAKGWGVSSQYSLLSAQIDRTSVVKDKVDTAAYIRQAEDFVFEDYEWHDYVLTDKWKKEGIERCHFCDGTGLFFSVKSKRFKMLKKAKCGDVLRFRCRIVEEAKPGSLSGYRLQSATKVKTVTPLAVSLSDREPWSLLPVRYGVVDYINQEKEALHILTQESRLVFFIYKGHDIQVDSFVKFREYEDRRNDDVVIHIADVRGCTKEEALPHMKSRIVVVDDINNHKRLFHIVLGKGLISGIVRFDQTDIRPEIGDLLRISYCVKKNKEGKKYIKLLEVARSDAGGEGLKATVAGHLSVKYKYDPYGDDQDGREPDFAFVEDMYVHRSILKKYGIKEDCDVTAKVVLGENGKWKVYALEVMPAH